MIKTTKLTTFALILTLSLTACNNESQTQNYTPTNETVSHYTISTQANQNNRDRNNSSNIEHRPAPATEPPLPPQIIPTQITIQETAFSTELTQLNLSLWGLENDDIVALKYMLNLTSLNLNYNNITDISPLAGLTDLTELRLLVGVGTDLTPLAGMTNLTTLELGLSNFHDTDLTPLLGLTNLTSFRLCVGGNQIDDLSLFEDLTSLTRLDIRSNQISDLTPLESLTNLRYLELSGENLISEISPLANLPNLNTLFLRYSPGMDLSVLYEIPPRISPPTLPNAPGNPHPFAEALTNFFVDLTTAAEWPGMPYSYHALLVDVDGKGTPGVVASRWTYGDRGDPFSFSNFISIHPHFTQTLFFMYDDELQEVVWHRWGVTPSGRLVMLDMDGVCGVARTDYILLDVNDGRLVGVKALTAWILTWGDNDYAVNYNLGEFLVSGFEHMQQLTHKEFYELMRSYNLYGTSPNIWELPDDTYTILAMTAY